MTRLPTVTAIRHLTDSLRNLTKPPAKGQRTRLDDIELRLIAAVERDRTGSPTPDGYPASSLGGGNSANTGSTVEAAALAPAPRDRHHELTTLAVRSVENAVLALNTLRSALASIDDLTHTSGPAPRTCAHCTPHLPQGHARPVHSRGTVGNRLAVAIDLCRACYNFVARSSKPAEAGQLPTPEQIRWHDQHGTWRIHVRT